MRFTRLSRCLAWAAAAAVAGSCLGQVMQPPGTMPDGRRFHPPGVSPPRFPPPSSIAPQPSAAAAPGAAAATPTPQPGMPSSGATASNPVSNPRPLPPSLLDKPPGTARIGLSAGQLSVYANNSSLSQILQDLSTISGMTVDGFDRDQRVFGIYGPGDPREILSELLDGAGYNFLMVGTTEAGTPREVVLTARSSAPLAPSASTPSPQPDDEDEPVVNNYPPEQVSPPPRPPMTPGQDSNGQPNQPRTPQEIIQELQRMRQQQQQNQPAPQ